MLMWKMSSQEGFGNILCSAILFYLESVWLLRGFLLFVSEFISVWFLAGTNDLNWVTVLCLPDEGDLSYVFFG